MKSNYKTIGQYIRIVDDRNVADSKVNLLGVSVSKVFIKSIANTVGTDFTTYRVVKKNQFTYIPDTSRRGDKIGIALLENEEEGLVSQAYTVFEIVDPKSLLPEYLMMWFRRTEFDRYARFISHGSVREIFGWDDMCNVSLPIPNPYKQREIVKEYHTIVNRIKLNEQLCQKLEETAQAVYKQWFVDFEFPDENGEPYKSSGGEMEYNEEVKQEVPKGWVVDSLGNTAIVKAGGDKPAVFSSIPNDHCRVPIYSNSTANEGLFGYTDKPIVLIKSITISARGAIIGYTVLRSTPFVPIVRLIVVTPKSDYQLNYLFECIRRFKYTDSGSAQGQLTVPDISSFKIIHPSLDLLQKYQIISNGIITHLENQKHQGEELESFKDILLSKLATIDN